MLRLGRANVGSRPDLNSLYQQIDVTYASLHRLCRTTGRTWFRFQPYAQAAPLGRSVRNHCLRSVRNHSRSHDFVYQSVIPSLMADAFTPSYLYNLDLPRPLCPCGRPKKTLRAGSFVSMRTTWPAHRSLASFIRCTTVRSPYISCSSSL